MIFCPQSRVGIFFIDSPRTLLYLFGRLFIFILLFAFNFPFIFPLPFFFFCHIFSPFSIPLPPPHGNVGTYIVCSGKSTHFGGGEYQSMGFGEKYEKGEEQKEKNVKEKEKNKR
jgi:hypothetical protein